MASFSKMILVRAPVAVVWSYLENPLQVVAMSDRIVGVRDITPCDVGGYNCTVVYDLNGQQLDVDVQTVEYVRHERLVTRSERGVRTLQTWTVSDEGELTSVNVAMDYQLDIPLLGRVASSVAARMGENDMETMLLRLKDICEAMAGTSS
jgi:carbon monoxide dehydrogenase subunit G